MDKLVIKKVGTTEELEALYVLRKNVYTRWGYLERNGSGKDIDEYDEAPKSVHFVAFYKGKIVGTIRLISADKTVLPVEKEFDLDYFFKKINRSQAIEVSRMASNNHTVHHFADQRIMLGLIKITHDYALKVKKPIWFAVIDKSVYEFLFKMGIRWNKIGPTKEYMGSPSVPAMLFLPDAMKKLRILNEKAWKFIVEGDKNVTIII